MNKFFTLTIFLLLINVNLFSQSGDYYYSHYSPENEHIENENFAILQDNNGQMFFANSKGLLKFDGKFWTLIQTPSTVLSLEKDPTKGKIYIGCLDDFGSLEINNTGQEFYKSFYNAGETYLSFSKIILLNNNVYFKGDGCLFEYSTEKQKITQTWKSDSKLKIDFAFKNQNKLYINDKNQGVFVLRDNKFNAFPSILAPNEKIVFCTNGYIGTTENKLYYFNGQDFQILKTEADNYLSKSVINDGLIVDDYTLAISTNKGGCIFINTKTYKTTYIFNYFNGLPDDEVFAIAKDFQNGVWIAHEYGFTRIDLKIPFRNYSNYLGLEGHIEAAVRYNNALYVATSEGVYYLSEIKNSSEVMALIKKSNNLKDEKSENKEGKLNVFFRKQKQKFEKIKSIFKFGKRKKEPEAEQEEVSKEKAKTVAKSKSPSKPKQETKAVSSNENITIQSIKFSFKKIKGIDAKCRQLLLNNNQLLVASNNGIFQIDKEIATKISGEPISYLYLSNDKQSLYASTELNAILKFSLIDNKWKLTNSIFDFIEEVYKITEDDQKNIWLSSHNAVYQILANDLSTLLIKDTIKIKNPFSDEINLINYKSKIYIVVSNIIYSYDITTKKLIQQNDTSLMSSKFERMIQSENNKIWYYTDKTWKYFSEKISNNRNFAFLSIIKDVQDIFIDENNKYCLIITKNNQLYSFDISNQNLDIPTSNLFLRSVNDDQGNYLSIQSFEIDEDKSFLTFHFINAEYLDNSSLEYQYILVGKMDEWSDWSYENRIPFSSLTNGNYELKVRTRNALNQINESQSIQFVVNPPYWQQWWFYLIEMLFFGTLLGVSIWINRVDHSNPWISRVLTFITIVFFIEFLDTIIASYIKVGNSPVLSFIVQVCIALAILPFERVLSSLIEDQSKLDIKKIAKLKK